MLTYDTPALRQTGSGNLTGKKTLPTIWGTYMKLVTKYQISAINSCWERCDEKCAYMFNVYKNQLSQQTGSRNLMGPKTLPTIWGTYMKLLTKYQISAINSCWEKCGYMFNVYKNQQSRQTGSRNLMGPKTLPTIWGTYMKLVTKYQISAINSCWEKWDEKYLGRTDRGKTVYPSPPSGSRGIIMSYYGDFIHKLKSRSRAKLVFTSLLPCLVDHYKTEKTITKVNAELKVLCRRKHFLFCNL
jgi:hypothetical protein